MLRARADASYANLVHELAPATIATRLAWRWRIDQPVAGADLTRKSGDDVPARVCALFDLPLERLSAGDRFRIRLGRLLFDPKLPAAAICYVWDEKLAAGTWLANAYTDRVRMLVLRQGSTGRWFDESRDLRADFAAALNRGAARPVQMLRPFGNLHKREVLRLGVGLPLELTCSCLAPVDGLHCGRCNKCAERQAAFREAGLPDPTAYADRPAEVVFRGT